MVFGNIEVVHSSFNIVFKLVGVFVSELSRVRNRVVRDPFAEGGVPIMATFRRKNPAIRRNGLRICQPWHRRSNVATGCDRKSPLPPATEGAFLLLRVVLRPQPGPSGRRTHETSQAATLVIHRPPPWFPSSARPT